VNAHILQIELPFARITDCLFTLSNGVQRRNSWVVP